MSQAWAGPREPATGANRAERFSGGVWALAERPRPVVVLCRDRQTASETQVLESAWRAQLGRVAQTVFQGTQRG